MSQTKQADTELSNILKHIPKPLTALFQAQIQILDAPLIPENILSDCFHVIFFSLYPFRNLTFLDTLLHF